MLILNGLLSLLILMIPHVNADGQLYVYILCVFLLTMHFDMIIDFDHTAMLMNNFVYIFAAIAYVFLVFFEVLN